MANRPLQKKVLIADDSEILNNMLRDVFEDHGYEVFQSFDGLEAKTAFLKNQPDLVLIDLQLPKLDGFEVLRFIKDRSSRAIVILMTGVGSQEIAVKAMKLGADEYLSKPFEMDGIAAIAEKLLAGRKALEENIRLKKRIQRNEKYAAQLASSINEALLTTDSKGNIRFANRATSEMWGYSLDELMNKDIHFLIQAESRALLSRNLIKDTLRNGKAEGEFIFRKKDRGTFPGYLSSSLIQERGRNPDVVVVIADLTRLHEVERRLKYSEKMASLGKVVEGVAHEVRNCLTSLGGFALRLKKTVNDNPTGNEYVEIILKDVKRLEKMVKDIEEYVRFSKFHQFRMSSVDLVEIAQKARNRALQKLSSEMNRVVFVLNEESNLPKISADPEALEEVFYNIILNSYEAMPKGGRLKVDMKRIGSSIGILFSDTGIGIENEDLTEIFNPFVTSKTSGAGMGLSKALLLVEEHGGTLKVSSQPHKGAVFQLTLPIERSANGFS